jgi:hypothetical protein
MKLKDYNQMMSYLTRPKNTLTESMKKSEFVKEQKQKRIEENRINAVRKKYGLKPNQRPETMNERVDRLGYVYDDIGSKPKHMGNPNIVEFENMKKPKKIKKISRPINIDISGIDRDLSKYEQILNAPEPKYKLRKEEKLEGIETILGIKA